jgi:F0F1-type ATP synthase assembly protein I
MGECIFIGVGVVILTLYYFSPQIKATKTYQEAKLWIIKDIMSLPDAFQLAWDGFLFFGGIIVTLYISDATGKINMLIPWGIFIFFIILGILSGIRNRLSPKKLDTDTLKALIQDAVREGVAQGIEKGIERIKQLERENKTKESK